MGNVYLAFNTRRKAQGEARAQATGRRAARGGGGAFDLELARAAPSAVLATETSSVFYSRRVGCQTYQPLYYGVDIAALCLKAN